MTVKQQLVNRMLRNGNDFRYTDIIKTLLKICRGEDYEYTRADRGFYATNLCKTSNGYMVNGGGDCGLYKNEHGRWSAKYFTREDVLEYKIKKIVNSYKNTVRSITHSISWLSENPGGRRIIGQDVASLRSRLDYSTQDTIKSLKKVYNKAK